LGSFNNFNFSFEKCFSVFFLTTDISLHFKFCCLLINSLVIIYHDFSYVSHMSQFLKFSDTWMLFVTSACPSWNSLPHSKP
jgi:hypothetical protein